MAKTLLAMGFLSANLLHFPHGPAHARRLVEALFRAASGGSRREPRPDSQRTGIGIGIGRGKGRRPVRWLCWWYGG